MLCCGSGIQHPESAVRYQAAYYLKRLVRSFVTDHAIAAPLCEPLLKGIQVCVCACQLLAPSFDTPTSLVMATYFRNTC